MKRFFFMAAILSSLFGIVNAQNATNSQKTVAHRPETPQSMAKRKVTLINNVCHFHGDQFSKVNNVLIDFYTRLDAVGRQEHVIGKDAYNNKVTVLKNDLNASLKADLDPGQWQKWVADQKGRGK